MDFFGVRGVSCILLWERSLLSASLLVFFLAFFSSHKQKRR